MWQLVAVSLALALFLASGQLTAIAAQHTAHSGHDQTTHQQTWCSWLCAAGQALQAHALDPTQAISLVTNTEALIARHPSFLPIVTPQSRATPIPCSEDFLFTICHLVKGRVLLQTLDLVGGKLDR